MAVMSSYSIINGTHTANHRGMLTGLLRDEWGYDGIVMTGFGTTGGMGHGPARKYASATAPGCIQASNDLLMPGNPNDVATIIQAVNEGTLSKAQLQWCSVNMLRMLLCSHAFEA